MEPVNAIGLALEVQAFLNAEAVAEVAADRAGRLDRAGAFPVADIEGLRVGGLLTAPLPVELGGSGLCAPERVDALCGVLAAVGRGNLALGRLYEGHVNALALVVRYAAPNIRDRLARDARDGHLFGVWNTEPNTGGLVIDGERLKGAKSLASGAGHVTRPLVTARRPEDHRQMLVARLEPGLRADLSGWQVHGMRATATGTVDFTGITVADVLLVGGVDDYVRQPFFSAGAWRFLAVQLGGIEAVVEAHRGHLRATARGGDPHQRARLGEAATAAETAWLFVSNAARIAAAETDAAATVAYVNLARGAVERAGLETIALAQRSVGLAGFLENHPLERLARDLATYLRQPGPDHALTSAAGYILDADTPICSLWRKTRTHR